MNFVLMYNIVIVFTVVKRWKDENSCKIQSNTSKMLLEFFHNISPFTASKRVQAF